MSTGRIAMIVLPILFSTAVMAQVDDLKAASSKSEIAALTASGYTSIVPRAGHSDQYTAIDKEGSEVILTIRPDHHGTTLVRYLHMNDQ